MTDSRKAHPRNAIVNRRKFVKAGIAAALAVSVAGLAPGEALAAKSAYADPAERALPPSDMKLVPKRTALVITDPQNDFLSPKGVAWGVVGESVTEHGTVNNIESLFKAAKYNDVPVFVSPHYYYPTDHGWQFEGALEKLMHKIGMFDRKGALSLDAFEGSGADWLARYKPYIADGKTIVASPHKVYGPETNDQSSRPTRPWF